MIRKVISYKCPDCNYSVDIEEEDIIYRRKTAMCPICNRVMKKITEMFLGGLISEDD